jgi:predicted metal-dependent peptidase
MNDRLHRIIRKWYIEEPALFQIYSTHNLEENERISCVMRCGGGKIEYNPLLAAGLDDGSLELLLKAEVIRIMLKHPYDRQPDGCRKEVMGLASNLVLSDNYAEFQRVMLPSPGDYDLDSHESYEWYSYRLEKRIEPIENIHSETSPELRELENMREPEPTEQKGNPVDDDAGPATKSSDSTAKAPHSQKMLVETIRMPDGSELPIFLDIPDDNGDGGKGEEDGGETAASGSSCQPSDSPSSASSAGGVNKRYSAWANYDLASLWEEDYMKVCEIDYQIEIINNSHNWGSLSGDLIGEILARSKARIDYRKVLSGFRATILSSQRHLTRMRPNRRTGFDSMGSIRRFSTRILVAVDVSGSVNDDSLGHFFTIINRLFKYGVEELDLMQFDAGIKSVEKLEKKRVSFDIQGRGGTDFQIVFDYVSEHPKYDGLIIFTDGYAPVPRIPGRMRCKIVWVCNDKKGYDDNCGWMQRIGRCCLMEV